MKYHFGRISTFIILAFLVIHLPAQDSSNNEVKKSSWSFHIVESLRFEEGFAGRSTTEWSNPGMEGQLVSRITDRVNFQFKLGLIRWQDERETVFPIFIGTDYTFPLSKGLQCAFYVNAGTSAVIGNDFAAFFAGAETGLQFSSKSRRNLMGGIGWNKHFWFHPSEFDALKLYVGWYF